MEISDTQIQLAVFGALLILFAVLIAWIVRLEIRLKKLARGKDGASLESMINALVSEHEQFAKSTQALAARMSSAEETLERSITHVETLRFNPFGDTASGGNQSFATAFLNRKGDGVVISTIATRERTGVFSKPIKHGTSEYELTQEERQVLGNHKDG